MKKIILFSAAVLLSMVACKEQLEEVTDPAYARLFTPVDLEAEVQNVVNVTLKWKKVERAKGYTVELAASPDFASIVKTGTTEETSISFTDLDESVEYSARVKATGDATTESKWAVVTFKTTPPPPPETVEWNFSEEEFAEITEGDFKVTATVRKLDVVGGTGGVRRTTSAMSMDEYSFTHRLELRGGGTWNSDLTLANRLIHFKAEKPCVVTVYANSGTAGRTLKITDKNNEVLGEYLTTGSIGKVEVNVTEATDVNVYSGGSGIDVYLIKMVIGGKYEPDHSATLKSLAVTGETFTPAFSPDVAAYEVNVAKSVTAVTIAAGKNHVNQTLEGDGEQIITADSVVFPVKVTAEDGTTQKTYSITVKREKTASSDATLKELKVDKGALTPAFSPSVTEYTDTVNADVTTVTITATATHKFAKVGDNGAITAPPSGLADGDTLSVGDNGPYQIVVLAENNTVKTYSVKIVRKAPQVAGGGGGENKWWNFSSEAFKSLDAEFTTTYTIDGLEIIGGGSSMRYNENSKSMDDYTFTHRLQLNGTGSTTARAVKFDVTGACTITVYMITGSGSTVRPLVVHDGTDKLTELKTEGSAISKYTYNYTGGSGTLYLYSEDSGINLYGIKVDY